MCRIDYADGDFVSIKSNDRRHAKKQHRCEECGRTIDAGEIYFYGAAKVDGDFMDWATCWHCRVGQQWLIENCGGYLIGEVAEELREHAEEYPVLSGDLLSFVDAMERGWK